MTCSSSENVGNLICLTHWDLGEDLTVCLMSASEGHDKPLKYPAIFAESDVIVLNKIDLLGLYGFERPTFLTYLRALTEASLFALSCRTGVRIGAWEAWLLARCEKSNSSS